ncbi:uncharacterized protein [Euphorbia lathyris]|uniref:uncharacterized protein isoform X2 n=1 Tax=Euphorbia lathyris TaxID=212925 RepID=UPI003313F31B
MAQNQDGMTEKIKLKPYSGMLNINFGKRIGKRDEVLKDRSKVNELVELLNPIVRAFDGIAGEALDGIAGERVSMRVDLESLREAHILESGLPKLMNLDYQMSSHVFSYWSLMLCTNINLLCYLFVSCVL